MISILRHAYEHTQCYLAAEGREHVYRPKRGVKGGFALCLLLFCAVYECFHRTLLQRITGYNFLCIWTTSHSSSSSDTTQQVLSEVSRISAALGFCVKNTKPEIYKSSASTTNEIVLWQGVPHKVRPPMV